jgi:hypothetical protein
MTYSSRHAVAMRTLILIYLVDQAAPRWCLVVAALYHVGVMDACPYLAGMIKILDLVIFIFSHHFDVLYLL